MNSAVTRRLSEATRYAFEDLVKAKKNTEREIVQWIRELEAPKEVALTESLY